MMVKDNNTQTNTIIGPNTVFQGNLDVQGSVLVYGTIFGDITAAGLVRTAQESLVKGAIVASEAVIDGSLEGSLAVKGRATMGASARVIGEVKVDMLVIEEGAQFSGKCKMKGAKPSTDGAPRHQKKHGQSDHVNAADH